MYNEYLEKCGIRRPLAKIDFSKVITSLFKMPTGEEKEAEK